MPFHERDALVVVFQTYPGADEARRLPRLFQSLQKQEVIMDFFEKPDREPGGLLAALLTGFALGVAATLGLLRSISK